MKQIQSINFDGVTSFTEAKSKKWSILGSLNNDVQYPGIEFFNSKLYIIGSWLGNEKECIQIFDLATNTTQS